jgi:hypothetical protein
VKQLSLLEAPQPDDVVPPVWSVLDEEQRAGIVAALARLIAKTGGTNTEQEKNDE